MTKQLKKKFHDDNYDFDINDVYNDKDNLLEKTLIKKQKEKEETNKDEADEYNNLRMLCYNNFEMLHLLDIL